MNTRCCFQDGALESQTVDSVCVSTISLRFRWHGWCSGRTRTNGSDAPSGWGGTDLFCSCTVLLFFRLKEGPTAVSTVFMTLTIDLPPLPKLLLSDPPMASYQHIQSFMAEFQVCKHRLLSYIHGEAKTGSHGCVLTKAESKADLRSKFLV